MYTPSLFDETSGPSGPLVRVQLVIAYDGSGFRGLAPNPGVRTVVGDESMTYGVAVADVNGDAYPDLAFANSDGHNEVLLNIPLSSED